MSNEYVYNNRRYYLKHIRDLFTHLKSLVVFAVHINNLPEF